MTRVFFTLLATVLGAAIGAVLAMGVYRYNYPHALISCPRLSLLSNARCLGSPVRERYVSVGGFVGLVVGNIGMLKALRRL